MKSNLVLLQIFLSIAPFLLNLTICVTLKSKNKIVFIFATLGKSLLAIIFLTIRLKSECHRLVRIHNFVFIRSAILRARDFSGVDIDARYIRWPVYVNGGVVVRGSLEAPRRRWRWGLPALLYSDRLRLGYEVLSGRHR